MDSADSVYDFVIIGSGFGGSVSAMRLTEKGYSVLVLEKGKRFKDQDFPKNNWAFWKFLWNPWIRSFGIMQISTLSGMLVVHGAGVGGGSLTYANVLMEPSNEMFEAPAWKDLADWKAILRPHYDMAKRMLGVTSNPYLGASENVLYSIAEELGQAHTFSPTSVGVFFGEPGKEGDAFPDPYFDGRGPERNACNYCGGCMVGCRYNAKNTLVKNYLYFAEKGGARVQAEVEVRDVHPLPPDQPDGARYQVEYRSSTAALFKGKKVVRAKNVIFSAGVLGTLKLLFRCRDITGSLPKLSGHLGEMVRTNSEALLAATARKREADYSKGVAIGSVFQADEVTNIEPVRFPSGSDLIRFLAWPLLDSARGALYRLGQVIAAYLRRPLDFLINFVFPGWAERTTIFLVMQTVDNQMTVRHGRDIWTFLRKGLVTKEDKTYDIPTKIEIGHDVTRRFADKVKGFPAGSISESLFGMPSTAHILGGCPMGRGVEDGVVDVHCQVFNYPGLYVVDGSIMPANPGINPSLTITALAEYAMSHLPEKSRVVPDHHG